ncbi:10466_t:CDS:2, partial [Cetraspora pellucida]
MIEYINSCSNDSNSSDGSGSSAISSVTFIVLGIKLSIVRPTTMPIVPFEPIQETHVQQCDNQEFIQLVHEQLSNNQEFVQLVYKSSDEESDSNNDLAIQVGAEFPNWESLKNTLKKYETEVGFKAIKFQIEHNNARTIVHQYFGCENSRECQSKKNLLVQIIGIKNPKRFAAYGSLMQVINKLVKNHNHTLVPYQKEFAPSLYTFLQK